MTVLIRAIRRLPGPAVFVALVLSTDFAQVRSVWEGGRPLVITAAALLSVPVILVKAWRWRRLLDDQGIRYAYPPAARYYAVSCALGAWTPGRLGDFSKAIAVRRDCGVGFGRAVSSVLADRILDALLLGGVGAIGAAFLPGPHGPWIAAAGVGGAILAAFFLLRGRAGAGDGPVRRGARRIVAAARRSLSGLGGTGRELNAAIDGLVLLARPRASTVAATVAAAGVVWFQGWLLARGLGVPVGFWALAVALSAVSIASLIPVSVAGLGTREATLAIFLVPGGVPLEQVIGYSLAYFVVISGTVGLIGAAAWSIRPAVRVSVAP